MTTRAMRRSTDALHCFGASGLRAPRCSAAAGTRRAIRRIRFCARPLSRISPRFTARIAPRAMERMGRMGRRSIWPIPNIRRWSTTPHCGNGFPAGCRAPRCRPLRNLQGGMLTDAQVNALIAGMREAVVAAGCIRRSRRLRPTRKRRRAIRIAARRATRRTARCATRRLTNKATSRSRARCIWRSSAIRLCVRSSIAGRPDIGQPDWRHDGPGGKAGAPLSAQDVDDIVTYLASLRTMAPAGGNEHGVGAAQNPPRRQGGERDEPRRAAIGRRPNTECKRAGLR